MELMANKDHESKSVKELFKSSSKFSHLAIMRKKTIDAHYPHTYALV
jgi:hypothetical protein